MKWNRNTLKYIAVAAMIVDHIGLFFVPVTTFAGILCRVIGRITAPTMCFFLAEGYAHTHAKKKYAVRLLIFGIISQIPYALSHYNQLLAVDFNMILLLFLAFLMLIVNDRFTDTVAKIIFISALLLISVYFDWGMFGPLFVLAFYYNRGRKNRQAAWFALIAAVMVVSNAVLGLLRGEHWYGKLWQLGMFLFIPLLYGYNGSAGKKNTFHKWFFYAVYPAHLLIIWIIKYVL